jgi:ribonucleoside-diphosphate reductase alpha chain
VKNGGVNWELLSLTIHQAVHFMDNVIGTTEYFYPENAESQKQIRRIGLGTMGLADMLIQLKIRYGSDEAIAFCEKLYPFIRDEAYRASIELAKLRGSFGSFDKEKYLQGEFIKTLPQDVRAAIAEHGIRNALLLTQAPTGTTSLLSGASSGIEPVYDFVVIRKDRLGEHEMYHSLYEEWRNAHPGESLPDYFVTAKGLSPEEHIKMQAVIQKYVDASISKTVNAPHSHTVEDVKKLYIMAHDLGCKGMAYYRDGSRDMAVLQSKEVKQTDEPEKPAMMPDDKTNPQIKLTPKPRPEIVSGSTYKVKTGYGTLFVTVNNDEDGKPFEVFAAIGKTGGFFAAKSEAICRLISLALRAGIDVEEVIEQLKGIRGPMPSWSKYGQVLSIPDAISHVLREHVNSAQQKLQLDFKEKTEEKLLDEKFIQELPAANMEHHVSQEMKTVSYAKTRVSVADRGLAPECPNCHGILELGEGCMLCRSCGYSKCS